MYNSTIFAYFFSYFNDNLGQLKLKGLLAIAVGSWSGVAEIDNGPSFILLSWVSDIKVNISILLDNRETSANVYKVGSSTRLDEYGESG